MTQFMLLPPLFWPRIKTRAQSQTLISSYDLVHFPLQGATPPLHTSPVFPQLRLNFNPQMSYFHFLKAFVLKLTKTTDCSDLDDQLE